MFGDIKVIVADIDGTLARQSHYPSEYTLRMIDEVKEKGYLFGLASGRTLDDVIEYHQLWNLKEQFDFIIAWNGCELWDNLTQRKYEYNKIAKQDLKEICRLMGKFECTVSMYLPQVYLTTEKNARTLLSAGKSKRKLIVAESMEDFYRRDNFGIMFRFDRSLMSEVENYLAQYSDRNFNFFKTQPDLMEFSHKEANKAYALKQFCLMHDIPLQQCLAFGDTTNDNELLRCCQGVCLLNGTEDTKRCAQAVTDLDNEHDGCAHYIKKYLLKSAQ